MTLAKKAQDVARRRLAKLANGRALSASLIDALTVLAGPWLLENGYVAVHPCRIAINKDGKKKLDSITYYFRLMEDRKPDRGQQTKEHARKTLRAIAHRKLTWEQISERMQEFGKLCYKDNRSKAAAKPFTEPKNLKFGETGITARKLTCANDFARVGHEMSNCFANLKDVRGYLEAARCGQMEFISLQDGHGEAVAVLSICNEGAVWEMKGKHNGRAWKYRPQLLALLKYEGIQCSDCVDASEVAICDKLLLAKAEGKCKRVRWDDGVCEVGNKVLAIIHGDKTLLLQRLSESELRMTIGADGTEPALVRRSMRKWFRAARAAVPKLRAACDDAFPGVDVMLPRFWKNVD